MMPSKNYYSTQPFLAWCLNHYFYGQKHFTYIGSPFYPFQLGNPRSSNPFRAYEDFYEPWKERDEYSKQISAMRLNLRRGIKTAPVAQRKDLRRICRDIEVAFFYPIVYCVDVSKIDNKRLIKAGSGARTLAHCEPPSNEYLIKALSENEFSILFLDFETEVGLNKRLRNDLNTLWNKKNDLSFSIYAQAILDRYT